jgi:hypothetical protein
MGDGVSRRAPNGLQTIEGLVDATYVDSFDGEEIEVVVALVLGESFANLAHGRVSLVLHCSIDSPGRQRVLQADLPITTFIDPTSFPEGCDGSLVVGVQLRFVPPEEGIYDFAFRLEDGPLWPLHHYVEIDRGQGRRE